MAVYKLRVALAHTRAAYDNRDASSKKSHDLASMFEVMAVNRIGTTRIYTTASSARRDRLILHRHLTTYTVDQLGGQDVDAKSIGHVRSNLHHLHILHLHVHFQRRISKLVHAWRR